LIPTWLVPRQSPPHPVLHGEIEFLLAVIITYFKKQFVKDNLVAIPPVQPEVTSLQNMEILKLGNLEEDYLCPGRHFEG